MMKTILSGVRYVSLPWARYARASKAIPTSKIENAITTESSPCLMKRNSHAESRSSKYPDHHFCGSKKTPTPITAKTMNSPASLAHD